MWRSRTRPSTPGGTCSSRARRPVLGGIGALGVWVAGEATDSRFLVALAYTGFLLNLFNLIPVRPLDGGFMWRSVKALRYGNREHAPWASSGADSRARQPHLHRLWSSCSSSGWSRRTWSRTASDGRQARSRANARGSRERRGGDRVRVPRRLPEGARDRPAGGLDLRLGAGARGQRALPAGPRDGRGSSPRRDSRSSPAAARA